MAIPYGRGARPLWHLAPDAIFLNHGSFGACPREVLAEQERLRLEMEAQPDRFLRALMPTAADTPLRKAVADLARFVGAREEQLAPVENATSGVQAVVRSMSFAPGDEILITDHTYNAVRLIVEARCAETGARAKAVRLPMPCDADAIVQAFGAGITPRVRLVIVDHITSPTALVLPVERIAAQAREAGARVLVDGAHAVGQVPLDLTRLDVDWYVSNAHKWLFAPKGTAFLYAAADAAALTAPPVVSHFVSLGFPRSFDWAGTRDYTAWLALPAALRFFESLDPPAARAYRERLVRHATRKMLGAGARAVADDSLCGSMRSFALPQSRPAVQADADSLMRDLWERHRIQSMATAFGDALLVRISTQAYVDEADLDALASVLDRDGWPGR
jgi:isopenicillin-N epimerase